MEKANHSTVDKLVALNYPLAEDARRVVYQIWEYTTDKDGNKHPPIRTVPCMREHQDALAICSQAGEFFQVTNGGAILTSIDLLIDRERRLMATKYKVLLQQKQAKDKYAEVVVDATQVFSKRCSDWKKSDFETAFLYKQGPILKPKKGFDSVTLSVTKVKSMSILKLREVYKDKYKGKRRDQSNGLFEWTAEDDRKLNGLKSGNIDDYCETEIYSNSVEQQKEFLITKHTNLPFKRQVKIYKGHAISLSNEQKKQVANAILGIELPLDKILVSSFTNTNNDDDTLKTVHYKRKNWVYMTMRVKVAKVAATAVAFPHFNRMNKSLVVEHQKIYSIPLRFLLFEENIVQGHLFLSLQNKR